MKGNSILKSLSKSDRGNKNFVVFWMEFTTREFIVNFERIKSHRIKTGLRNLWQIIKTLNITFYLQQEIDLLDVNEFYFIETKLACIIKRRKEQEKKNQPGTNHFFV